MDKLNFSLDDELLLKINKMLRRLPKNCVDGEGNNKENHHIIRTNIERENFLLILIMFGTVEMHFKQTVAVFFIILFVCVGVGSYCMKIVNET